MCSLHRPARTVQWKYSKAWCSTLLVVAMAATQLLSLATNRTVTQKQQTSQ
jgi:hypothetical protein